MIENYDIGKDAYYRKLDMIYLKICKLNKFLSIIDTFFSEF